MISFIKSPKARVSMVASLLVFPLLHLIAGGNFLSVFCLLLTSIQDTKKLYQRVDGNISRHCY